MQHACRRCMQFAFTSHDLRTNAHATTPCNNNPPPATNNPPPPPTAPRARRVRGLKRRHGGPRLPHVPHAHHAVAAPRDDLRGPVAARAPPEPVHRVYDRRVRPRVKQGRGGRRREVPQLQAALEAAGRKVGGGGGGGAEGGALEAVGVLGFGGERECGARELVDLRVGWWFVRGGGCWWC